MSTTAAPASAAHDPVLDVRDLTVTFPTRDGVVRAVSDVSFTVQAGRILGVVGESGSGKSVTAKAILRMLRAPGRVEHGSVILDGTDVLDRSEQAMRHVRGKQVSMIFQDPQAALNPVMTVGDQIAEALIVHGVSRPAARTRAKELLAQVGIPEVERTVDQYPHEFSGGMRQRVVIAIALANKPSVIIADEPTTALDVTIQSQILELLAQLRRELGVAIILITHDMGVVAELCDDVMVMYAGRVVEHGSVSAVFEKPRHPYTHALLRAVPRLDVGRREPLLAIPGTPPDPARLPVGCSFAPRCPVAVDRCRTERPPLAEVAPHHPAACWVSAAGEAVDIIAPAATAPQQDDPTHAATSLLRITHLRTNVATRAGLFSRNAPVFAVNDVSLDLYAGETLGLVGESGCGKSTLSRTIVGIAQPADGRITVDGRDVTAMRSADLRAIAASVQYVFQDPYASLNPRRTIGQSLEEAVLQAGERGAAVAVRVRELMGVVGLHPGHLDRYPYAFSGGQRQRIGIARALAARPKVLILDEPVSALDVSIQAQILQLLERLRDEFALAYLFIAHDLAVVRHLSDRVAVMYLGRIVEMGTADEVYDHPQHPYTAALLSSTPEPHVAVRARERIVLRGDLPSLAKPPSGCPFRTRCPIGPIARPDREICRTTRPELNLTPAGQVAACHFPGELVGVGVAEGGAR